MGVVPSQNGSDVERAVCCRSELSHNATQGQPAPEGKAPISSSTDWQQEMVKSEPEMKRRNKVSGLGEALGGVLDPVFAKRGFASREIMTNWAVIAPANYKDVTFPERLQWKRQAGDEGGTLYLRCAEAQRLAVSHDTALIAGSVNRYFGYVLVKTVKLSAEPFTQRSASTSKSVPEPDATTKAEIEARLADLPDEELKAALSRLGYGLKSRG